MATPLLITRADFAGRVILATNMDDARINNAILEAQDFDLRELMGDAFYWKFIKQKGDDPTLAWFEDLLNGKSFTINSVDYIFYGVKPVIVYYATARLIKTLDLNFTPYGMMQKRNDFSDHVDPKDLTWRANQYGSQAISYWNLCIPFLDANKTTYTLWKPECDINGEVTTSPRISGLGGGKPNGHELPFINRRF